MSVMSVDTVKGTEKPPLLRSRSVARAFNTKGDKELEDLFAATPPLNLKRTLFSLAASIRAGNCFLRTQREPMFT